MRTMYHRGRGQKMRMAVDSPGGQALKKVVHPG